MPVEGFLVAYSEPRSEFHELCLRLMDLLHATIEEFAADGHTHVQCSSAPNAA